MKITLKFKVSYRWDPSAGGWWVTKIPALPGCVSQGKTLRSAKRHVTQAASLWLKTLIMETQRRRDG